MLQNLAYGEKIVKYQNGFHIAVESVKRTQSVLNITRKYYREFLKGRSIENVIEDDLDDVECNEDPDVGGECMENHIIL